MTSKVIQGDKQRSFYLKIHFFFCLCYWLVEETNAAEHYERTKFDLYNDDIYLVFTLIKLPSYGQLFVLVCLRDQMCSTLNLPCG